MLDDLVQAVFIARNANFNLGIMKFDFVALILCRFNGNFNVFVFVLPFGGFFYRQRGAVTDFASFDGLAAGASVGLSPAIKMLLGIPKPAVA